MKRSYLYFIFLNLFILLAVHHPRVQAQESYQTEIIIAHIRSTEVDNDPDDEKDKTKTNLIMLNQYFAPVNTSNHPLAEAAFLERVGSFGLFFGESKTEFEPRISFDGLIYGGTLTLLQKQNPFAFRATYLKSDQEYDPPINADEVVDFYNLEVGFFIREGFMIGIGYRYREGDLDVLAPGTPFSVSVESDQYTLATKFVSPIGGGRFINLEAEFVQEEEKTTTKNVTLSGPADTTNKTIAVSADFYFNRRVSLGGGFASNTGDDKDQVGTTLSANARAFITPNFAVSASFDQFSAENTAAEDEEGFTFAFLVRF